MKRILREVLAEYSKQHKDQVNLASESAQDELAENLYRAVGNFFHWWGKTPPK